MSYWNSRVLTALFILLPPFSLLSQNTSELRAGMRVHIVLPSTGSQRFGVFQEHSVRGELVATSSDSLFLRVHPSAGVMSIPNSAVVSVFVSKGKPSRWRSALRALPYGAILGAGVANTFFEAEFRGPQFRTRHNALLAGAIVGGLTNAASAATFPSEQWRRVRP